MFFAAMNSTSVLDGSFVLNGIVQWMERPINKAEILIVMTLTSYIFMSIFKSKEKSNEKKVAVQKDPAGKTLSDYSFRDLFHFFINQEFHTDKLHLAKGECRESSSAWVVERLFSIQSSANGCMQKPANT